MGTYLKIKKFKKLKPLLINLFEKHKAINPNQFQNDFGENLTFEDIFVLNHNKSFALLKIGVLEREFYSREFLKELYLIFIENGKFNLIPHFENNFEVKGIPKIKRIKQLSYMQDACNIYCFSSTKYGGDWKNNPKQSLLNFFKTSDVFLEDLFKV